MGLRAYLEMHEKAVKGLTSKVKGLESLWFLTLDL